jgi:hypothetical protein
MVTLVHDFVLNFLQAAKSLIKFADYLSVIYGGHKSFLAIIMSASIFADDSFAICEPLVQTLSVSKKAPKLSKR